MDAVRQLAIGAKGASHPLSLLSSQVKTAALKEMARVVWANRAVILRENRKDVAAAQKRLMPASLISRLELTEAKLKDVSGSIARIASLPEPVGRVLWTRKRPNGLLIKKISVPIGVILIIYESRPNVTADCMALCLKSGNSVILKGGSEAAYSNSILFSVLSRAAVKMKVPRGAFQLAPTGDRGAVKDLLGMSDLIDLVIPRGGEGLIREVTRVSRIPVIKHYKGVCHVYVDKDADLKKAAAIVINAKTQNPSVCNAMETLLVQGETANKFLPMIADQLRAKKVEMRGCGKTRMLIPDAKKAAEEDWYAEYLDLVLAVRVVRDVNQAVEHIQKYGSRHSDAIVTNNKRTAEIFSSQVDSACVFINASTRFNDGGEFGMGAEMGISTDKLHARGPMGLEELTSYKYVVLGNGQVRR